MPNQTIYLAYGSNLNLLQMVMRCGTAEILGKTELQNHELKFRGDDGYAVATVEPGEGSVPAVLWKLMPEDERALDRYEGWPRLYRKETVEALLDGKTVEAMVYIMNDGHELGRPSERYLRSIREGYRDWKFDDAVLDQAVERSISNELISQNLFREKLQKNMEEMKKDWLNMSHVELIGNAHDISLTQNVFDSMINTSYAPEIVEYLVQLKNPLEVVRDQCLEIYIDFDSSLEDVLEDLTDFAHNELSYPLDTDYALSEPQQEMEF